MNYIPASELEKLILEHRSPNTLGMPISIYLNELCHAPFASPVAATRAAVAHVETMNGGKSLPWYKEGTYGANRSVCDHKELRASVFCFPMPIFPHPSEQEKNPEFVCGWNAVVLVCPWAPLTLADRAPQPGDLYRRWDDDQKRYYPCTDLEKFNDGYNYIEHRNGQQLKRRTEGSTLLTRIEYVGKMPLTEEATNGS